MVADDAPNDTPGDAPGDAPNDNDGDNDDGDRDGDGSRHIDGHDYFYALSEMLDSAKECIFILVRCFSSSFLFTSCLPPFSFLLFVAFFRIFHPLSSFAFCFFFPFGDIVRLDGQ